MPWSSYLLLPADVTGVDERAVRSESLKARFALCVQGPVICTVDLLAVMSTVDEATRRAGHGALHFPQIQHRPSRRVVMRRPACLSVPVVMPFSCTCSGCEVVPPTEPMSKSRLIVRRSSDVSCTEFLSIVYENNKRYQYIYVNEANDRLRENWERVVVMM